MLITHTLRLVNALPSPLRAPGNHSRQITQRQNIREVDGQQDEREENVPPQKGDSKEKTGTDVLECLCARGKIVRNGEERGRQTPDYTSLQVSMAPVCRAWNDKMHPLTGRNKQQEDGKQHHVGANARHHKDGAKNRHGDQKEGKRGVELLLTQSVCGRSSRGVQPVGPVSRNNGGAKGEPETPEKTEDGGGKGIS